jgi:hypothetical protein
MERYCKVKKITAPLDEIKFVVGQHTLAPELTPNDFGLEVMMMMMIMMMICCDDGAGGEEEDEDDDRRGMTALMLEGTSTRR